MGEHRWDDDELLLGDLAEALREVSPLAERVAEQARGALAADRRFGGGQCPGDRGVGRMSRRAARAADVLGGSLQHQDAG